MRKFRMWVSIVAVSVLCGVPVMRAPAADSTPAPASVVKNDVTVATADAAVAKPDAPASAVSPAAVLPDDVKPLKGHETIVRDESDLEDLPPWYMSIGAGYLRYEGDEPVKAAPFGYFKLGYDLNLLLSFEASAVFLPYIQKNDVYNYDKGYPELREGLNANSTWAAGAQVDAIIHLNFTENRHFDPYLVGGLGSLYYGAQRANRPNFDETFRYGAGIAYHFNPAWAIRGDFICQTTVDTREFNLAPNAGVYYHWGTDVPKKFTVSGGALDSDGDGLIDDDEAKWKTDPHNPDTDGDGLQDGEEVHTTHTDPLNPDSDYDGLTDGQEVKIYKTDPNDRDTDKGGVSDGHEVREDGTNPLNGADDLILFTLHLEFETDKSIIRPEYYNDLNKIGKVLMRDPKSVARIEGHADKRKTSKADYNLGLSERRANAVMEYLHQYFKIEKARMKGVGYGFTRPVEANDPVKGSAKNRRVEVYIRSADLPALKAAMAADKQAELEKKATAPAKADKAPVMTP